MTSEKTLISFYRLQYTFISCGVTEGTMKLVKKSIALVIDIESLKMCFSVQVIVKNALNNADLKSAH